jgi:hypothetical protein
MKIKNIDSKINIKRGIERKIAGRITFLGNVYSKIPFYLVNENTMDRISPPEKSYDEECLKEIFKERIYEREYDEKEAIEYLERTWERIKECSKKVYPAVGVYCKDGVSFLNINESSIFICPERIYDKKSEPDIIFQKVAIHELVHAYINRNYINDFEKIIEESLANAIAFLHFNGDEKEEIIEFINGEPVEYKGCYYWLKYNEFPDLYFILSSWKKNKFLTYLRAINYFYDWLPPYRWWLWDLFAWVFQFKDWDVAYKIIRLIKQGKTDLFVKFLSIEILREVI